MAYHIGRALIALREKNDADAETELKAALNLDSKSSAVYVALANLYMTRQDVKAATEAFATAAALSPPRAPIRMRLAQLKLQNGAPTEAKKMVEDIVREAPDYLPGRVFLMNMACNDKRDDDCANRVASVLSQDPSNDDALFQRGVIAISKGDATQAVRIFEQLSAMNSQDARARYELALAYLMYLKTAPADSQKALDAAETRLNEAVGLAPKFEQAILILSELKIRKGNAAAAVDLLLPLVKDKPELAEAQYLLATAYQSQQQSDKASAVFRQMMDLFPKDPKPPFLLGSILVTQGRQSEAREAFEKSIEISPDYLPPTESLINLDIDEKNYSGAIELAQKHIDKDPKSAQALALRGKIYLGPA